MQFSSKLKDGVASRGKPFLAKSPKPASGYNEQIAQNKPKLANAASSKPRLVHFPPPDQSPAEKQQKNVTVQVSLANTTVDG
ncbi:hypothetical protein ACNR90_002313 [Candidozyma auris]